MDGGERQRMGKQCRHDRAAQRRVKTDVQEPVSEDLAPDQAGDRPDRRENEDIGDIERLNAFRLAGDDVPCLLGFEEDILGAMDHPLLSRTRRDGIAGQWTATMTSYPGRKSAL